MDSDIFEKFLLAFYKEQKRKPFVYLLRKVPASDLSNYRTDEGKSLLLVAAQLGRAKFLAILLDYLNEHSKFNPRRIRPLTSCMMENYDKTLKHLFNDETEINFQATKMLFVYYCLFEAACMKGDEKTVKMFLERGFRIFTTHEKIARAERIPSDYLRPWSSLFKTMFESNQDKLVELILKCDNYFKKFCDKHNVYKECLKTVIYGKSINCVRLLLKVKFRSKEFILYRCYLDTFKEATPPIIQLLLDQDFGHLNREKSHVLHLAVTHCRIDVIKYFLNDDVKCRTLTIFSGDFYKYKKLNCEEEKYKYLEIAKLLLAHVVELQAEGKYIIPEEFLTKIDRDEDLKPFKTIAEDEIQLIRKQEFENIRVSLYDICKENNLIQFAAYLRNKDVVEFVKSEEFGSKFPVYCDKMRNKFEKGFKRNCLERRVHNFFQLLSTREENQLPRLPTTCVRIITNCMSNKDLIDLGKIYFNE